MTVPAQTPINRHAGNGVSTIFPYTFKVLQAGDLEVSVGGVVQTTGFTVSGVGSNTGDVTFSVPPTAGAVVVLRRVMAIQRTTDYQDQGSMPAGTVDDDHDAAVMMLQQVAAVQASALQYPVLEGISGTLPAAADRADKVLAFDSLGRPVMTVPTTDSAAGVRLDMASTASGKGAALVGFKQSGAGAVDRLVEDELRERVSVTQFGAVSGSDSTAAILAGMVVTAALGKALYIPSGRFIYTAGAQAIDNVCIVGEKMPSANSTSTALESGSIIVGTLKITGKNPTLVNIGIDHGFDAFPSSPENALSLSYAPGPAAGANRGGMARLFGVVGLCANSTDPYHAILVEGYADCFVDRCIGIKSYFPFAFKVQRANIGSIISRLSGLDGAIFKADTAYGDCDYVNAQNIVVEGAAGVTSNCVRIMSFDAQIERVNISNITGTGATRGLYVDVNGSTGVALNEFNIDNYSFSGVTTGMLFSAGAGAIYSANVGKGSCVGVGGRVIDTSGSVQALRINGLYGSLSASSPNVADAINIGSSVASFSADNVDLVVNYSTTNLAGMALANSYTSNWIGRGKFNMSGVGIPRDGFSDVTVTGTSQTLTPVYDGRNKESFIRVVPSAGATVSTISREMTSGVRFPYGYRLTIVNDSLNSLVINNSPAGYITNRGAANFTLASNEAVTYTFMSAVWHMTT